MYEITISRKGVISVTVHRSTMQAAIEAAREAAAEYFGPMMGERVFDEAEYWRNDELRKSYELVILL